jgi:1,5-anhydro-D-fructose reductase (1,5-anhydro-D-mannitol-forming)
MKKLKVAMLGMAHVHAEGYAESVREHPEAELTCIWDDDAGRRKLALERFGVPVLEDLGKTLAAVDAVVVNAPTSQHPQVIGAALRAGRHVFTEKALTVSTREADEIVKLARSSGVKFMISLPSRTRPEILFMKEVLDKGLLGKVTLMRARVAHCASLERWFHDGSAWFADEKLAGGGALFDLGCHTTDVMRWCMGAPRRFVSILQNFSGAYPIDDNAVAVIEFANGALGILDTSWVHRAGPNPYEIYGTEGYLGIGAAPGAGVILHSTRLAPEGIQGYISPTELPERLPMPMNQWFDSILRGTPVHITVEDGRNLTEMLEGIYTAARTRKEYAV